jgi:hypothetical protein
VRTFKYTIRLPCTIMQASQTDLCMAGGHVWTFRAWRLFGTLRLFVLMPMRLSYGGVFRECKVVEVTPPQIHSGIILLFFGRSRQRGNEYLLWTEV